ncbi:hypothetical protein [Kribbella soli]|uniref:Uncharacterized protein n=1 Tax=Kribbella soli TaxID=1124743 RepID=A0A4V2LZD0_9ACTN|nr:hypothetical protein [Kribbella soli]TCC07746.1 hypothetical protein E0H45_17465 [Kribbella soli]
MGRRRARPRRRGLSLGRLGQRSRHQWRPFAQTPDAQRWIGQSGTGADNQTYGLVYDTASGPFTGYSQSIWTMSKFKLDLPADGSITRRIVAVPNGGAADKFAVLNPFAF